MSNYFLSVCLALFAWWSTTALVLFLNHLPRSSYRWSILAATVLMICALIGLDSVVAKTTVNSAILAFVQALIVWAWLEMTYFMGWVTGPSEKPCPPNTTGYKRFFCGLATSLYHELSVVIAGVIILLISWNEPNQIGSLTFLTLWFMRWSAKMNLFLGVPNVNQEWFPPHLAYLTTYIKRQSVSAFFSISLLLATACLLQFTYLASTASSDFHQIGFTLVAALITLALLEHVFMAIPMQDSALWNWAKRLADKQASS